MALYRDPCRYIWVMGCKKNKGQKRSSQTIDIVISLCLKSEFQVIRHILSL